MWFIQSVIIGKNYDLLWIFIYQCFVLGNIWVNAVNEYRGCIMGHYSGTWHLHLMQSFCSAYCFPHTLPFLSRMKRKPLRFFYFILITSMLQWGRRVRPRTLFVATASAFPRDGTAMENLTAKTARMRAQTCVVSQIVFNVVFIVFGLHKNDSEQSSKRFIMVALTASLTGVYLSMCPGNHSTNSKSRSCSTAWFTSVSRWSRERENESGRNVTGNYFWKSLLFCKALSPLSHSHLLHFQMRHTADVPSHEFSSCVIYGNSSRIGQRVWSGYIPVLSATPMCCPFRPGYKALNPCRELAEKYEQLF